jgi:hypothetical protein
LKTLLTIPLLIALALAGGYAACALMGWNPHPREMLFAAGAALIAGLLGVVPMVLTRGATQPAVAQAGLLGTVLHLLTCTMLGGGMLLVKTLRLELAYVFWLLALYWLTLIAVAAGYVHAVKQAPVGTTPGAPAPAQQS